MKFLFPLLISLFAISPAFGAKVFTPSVRSEEQEHIPPHADPHHDGWQIRLPEMPLGWSNDVAGCLVMRDYSRIPRNPWNLEPKIPLDGTLAVTYVDPTKNPKKGDVHEAGLFDLADPKTGLHLLTDNYRNESEVEFSPDGKSFLFTDRKKLDDFDSESGIYLMDLTKPICHDKCKPGQAQNPKLLVGGRPVGVPAWHHPHGEKFTYIQWGDAESESRFFNFDMKTMTSTPFAEGIVNIADPEVSYDGRTIVFKMAEPGDRSNQPSIFVMDSDGRNLKKITGKDYVYSDHDPVFSKDGRKVYFERYYGPYDWFWASQFRGDAHWYNWWGIVEVDVETSQEKVIAPPDACGKHFFWLPTVSPDGKHVMYSHVDVWTLEKMPWTDLWVSDIDGARPQKVPGSNWFYFFDWKD